MFPKPTKGSGKAARLRRKKGLEEHREETNLLRLKHDRYICQHCGGIAVHAHHVYGRGNSPEHKFESVDSRLSLCNDCHYAVHHGGELRITREDLIADLKCGAEKR